MKHIVVGTDGSEAAAEAQSWAVNLAKRLDGQMTIATVIAPGTTAVAAGERERVADLLEGEWSAYARAALPSAQTLLLEGDPRTALLEAAASLDADLLVLGSTGADWFPLLHLGHVAHAIAHRTNLPLVIVPRGGHSDALSPVLVGVDGSPGSAAAVAWTCALARSIGSDVIAVHVHHRVPQQLVAERQRELEQRCAEWTAPLRVAGVTTRVKIVEGRPISRIVEVAAAEHVPLVVLGTRGIGGFPDLRLGSVALHTLQRAEVPIAVVPA